MSELAKNLWLIPLNYKLTGFTSFIGAWLYKGEKTFVVDVGPAATVPVLLKALDELGVRRLDAVLLTHIHIDHAGGIGDFVSQLSVDRSYSSTIFSVAGLYPPIT